jgi:hypothetical protein
MSRSHIFRPLTDATGLLLSGATVSILDPDTGSLLGDALFTDDSSSSTLTNPFQVDNGYVDFYLENPKRVQLIATRDQVSLGVFLDIYPPAYEVITSVESLRIVNTPVAGAVLVASETEGEAIWRDPSGLEPAIPPESPHFLFTTDPNWAVSVTSSLGISTISITIPPGAPWDGSQESAMPPVSPVVQFQTISALDLSGRGPSMADIREVDLSAQTNVYTFSVTTAPNSEVYWVTAFDANYTMLFDWRRG